MIRVKIPLTFDYFCSLLKQKNEKMKINEKETGVGSVIYEHSIEKIERYFTNVKYFIK